jgi:hypothetical protein
MIVRTVGELIGELNRFTGDQRVLATWESVFREIRVYTAKDGTVIIDADHGFYRERIESGELSVYMNDDGGASEPNEEVA